MSAQQARKLRLLQDKRQPPPRLKTPSTIIVLMGEKPLAEGREFTITCSIKDSVRLSGNVDSRIDQQQAAGLILVPLRGFRELGCTGEFMLVAEYGKEECRGQVTVFFAPEVQKAEKLIGDARGLLGKFAAAYPDSRVEIAVSLEIHGAR